MGEDLCRYYARQHGVQATILRICGYQRPACGGIAADGSIDWGVADPAELAGRHIGVPHFKLYSPDDMAEAVARALAATWDGCEAYLVGCHAPYTAAGRDELAADPLPVIAARHPEAPAFFRDVGLEPKPLPFWYSFEKAQTRLGFRTRHDLGSLIAAWRGSLA
jgi:nucleoside-diphosphate-sugar epimerase